MTIHMQEADAARDFSKVMEHVRAGDEVQLEQDGACIAIVSDPKLRRPKPSHIEDIERRLRSTELEQGLVEADGNWAEDMKEARAVFNTPKEVPWA